MYFTNQICQWRMKSAGNKFTFFCSPNKKRQEKKKQQKIIFQPYLEGVLRKITVYFDLDHVKAMQKIPLQINKRFTCEHDTQAEGHKHYKWSKA